MTSSGIENTTAQMRDPARQSAFLAEASVLGTGGAIEHQEATGAAQLAASGMLPAEMGDRAAYEALGFTFGEPDPRDPLFIPATLPPGWTRKAGTGDPRGSSIVDEHGRERVSVFYKAAFYDRYARMNLVSLDWYVTCHVEYDGPLVLDDTWATPEAVASSLASQEAEYLADAARYDGYATEESRTPDNRQRCAATADEKRATAAKYAARLVALTGSAA